MFDVTCSASGTLLCLPYGVPAYMYVYRPHSLIARERRNKGKAVNGYLLLHLVSTMRFYGAYSTPVTGPAGNNACTYSRCGADE